uniref:Uncharacterized protein n=1 Tax=Aegilops tauschii subsp. strangulata TaxID=200361 RepID=A0A453DGX3_AEGTS
FFLFPTRSPHATVVPSPRQTPAAVSRGSPAPLPIPLSHPTCDRCRSRSRSRRKKPELGEPRLPDGELVVGGGETEGMAGRAAVRSCVQTALKAANSVVGLAGMAVILYALWVLRAWSQQAAGHLPAPWFIYTLLSLGIIMCLLTCSGHIAAETANSPCLSCVSFLASDTRSCVSVFY